MQSVEALRSLCRQLREERGWTRYELARRVGVERSLIRGFETSTDSNIETVLAIFRALNVSEYLARSTEHLPADLDMHDSLTDIGATLQRLRKARRLSLRDIRLVSFSTLQQLEVGARRAKVETVVQALRAMGFSDEQIPVIILSHASPAPRLLPALSHEQYLEWVGSLRSRIHQLRETSGLSVRALSRAIGISDSELHKILRKRAGVMTSTIRRVSVILTAHRQTANTGDLLADIDPNQPVGIACRSLRLKRGLTVDQVGIKAADLRAFESGNHDLLFENFCRLMHQLGVTDFETVLALTTYGIPAPDSLSPELARRGADIASLLLAELLDEALPQLTEPVAYARACAAAWRLRHRGTPSLATALTVGAVTKLPVRFVDDALRLLDRLVRSSHYDINKGSSNPTLGAVAKTLAQERRSSVAQLAPRIHCTERFLFKFFAENSDIGLRSLLRLFTELEVTEPKIVLALALLTHPDPKIGEDLHGRATLTPSMTLRNVAFDELPQTFHGFSQQQLCTFLLRLIRAIRIDRESLATAQERGIDIDTIENGLQKMIEPTTNILQEILSLAQPPREVLNDAWSEFVAVGSPHGIGALARALRLRSGKSALEFSTSTETRVSQFILLQFERGERNFLCARVFRIASACGLDQPARLFGLIHLCDPETPPWRPAARQPRAAIRPSPEHRTQRSPPPADIAQQSQVRRQEPSPPGVDLGLLSPAEVQFRQHFFSSTTIVSSFAQWLHHIDKFMPGTRERLRAILAHGTDFSWNAEILAEIDRILSDRASTIFSWRPNLPPELTLPKHGRIRKEELGGFNNISIASWQRELRRKWTLRATTLATCINTEATGWRSQAAHIADVARHRSLEIRHVPPTAFPDLSPFTLYGLVKFAIPSVALTFVKPNRARIVTNTVELDRLVGTATAILRVASTRSQALAALDRLAASP